MTFPPRKRAGRFRPTFCRIVVDRDRQLSVLQFEACNVRLGSGTRTLGLNPEGMFWVLSDELVHFP